VGGETGLSEQKGGPLMKEGRTTAKETGRFCNEDTKSERKKCAKKESGLWEAL